MFDFGAETNRARYTSSKPPQYPLEKITVPVILYYGMNDAYTTENVEQSVFNIFKHTFWNNFF